MAGSKSARGASASGKRKKSATHISSGGSTHPPTTEASPSSVSRRSIPPPQPPTPRELQNPSASQPQAVVRHRRQSESPGSHTSNHRPNKQPRTAGRAVQPTPPQPQSSDHHLSDEDSGDEDDDEEEDGHEGAEQFVLPPESLEPVMPLEALLSMPGRDKLLDTLSPDEDEGYWFGRNESMLVDSIRRVIQEKFDGPWYTWKVVPTHIQDRYFVQFAHRFNWDPLLTPQIRAKFNAVCNRRVKGMVNYARRTRKKPNWIGGDLWKFMTAYWDTADARKRSETASKNSTSDPDGLGVRKHLGGPKSHEQIQRTMSKEQGREVSLGEVFIKTHTRKDGSYVDEKSRLIGEAYEKKLQSTKSQLEAEVSSISDTASHAPELTTEQMNAIFLESTIMDSRGNPYGIGMLGRRYKKSKVDYEVGSSSNILCLQEKLKEAENKMEAMAEQNKRQLDFVMEQLRQLNPNLPQFNLQSSPPPPHATEPAVNEARNSQHSSSSSSSAASE